jgi:hypothetical protein
MGSSPEASVLAALEQAELAARERRLTASSEAESILSVARDRAERITAGADRRVDETIARLRRGAEADADAAIEELERVAAQQVPSSANAGPDDRLDEEAVAVVVARVLGEASQDAADEDEG